MASPIGKGGLSAEDVDKGSSFLLKIKVQQKKFFFWSFMMTKDKKRVLLTGNDAVVEGLCCAAGSKRRVVYAGYPITPASEIATRASVMLPRRGGTFIQMEDEIGSIQAISGAGLAGAIAVTATSGPGFSLMSEGLGFAVMVESPVICVNVQRGGPSTGMPTWMGQGDMMQARWVPTETDRLSYWFQTAFKRLCSSLMMPASSLRNIWSRWF